MTRFSLDEIPFSYYGSWLDLSAVTGNAVHSEDVHVVSHQGGMHPVLRLVPQDGSGVTRAETQLQGTPARLSWLAGDTGRIDAVSARAVTIRPHGRGSRTPTR